MPFLSRIGSSSAKAIGFSSAIDVYDVELTSDSTQLDLETYATAQGWDGVKRLRFTISSGVYLYSNSTSTAALTVSGSFPQGVFIVNNGIIIGKGGNGGAASSATTPSGSTPSASSPGTAGGDALAVSHAVTITNNGTVAGGGGGGGGGAAANEYGSEYGNNNWGSGGGGGGGGRGGKSNSSGASGGTSFFVFSGGEPAVNGQSGTEGTYTAAGSGGLYGYNNSPATYRGGSGGSGGDWGSAGSTGGTSLGLDLPGSPGAGGAAGKYATGNSYITWSVEGTRLGGVS